MFQLRALQANIGGLGFGILQLGLRLIDIAFGGDAAFVAILRQLQRLLIDIHGFIENLLHRIVAANGEIIGGEFGMETEIDAFHIGLARLGAAFAGGHFVADLAP